METDFYCCFYILYRKTFYPTYEEWKLRKSENKEIDLNAFYPTYEEWKHNVVERGLEVGIAFYPTYEEWKLEYSDGRCFLIGNFLSYL